MSVKLYQEYFENLNKISDKICGVVDNAGLVVACTRQEFLGIHESDLEFEMVSVPLFLRGGTNYSIFAKNTGESSNEFVRVISTALITLKKINEEYSDQEYFWLDIISGKTMNFTWKAKWLGIKETAPRVVLIIAAAPQGVNLIIKLIKEIFPQRSSDFVFESGVGEICVVKEMSDESGQIKLKHLAQEIADTVTSEVLESVVIGIGGIVKSLDGVKKSYEEAKIALETGGVFENKSNIYAYSNLGISRLITSIPQERCKAFLNEVLPDNILNELDSETLTTIQKFFDYDLNISLASRELYVHRNTLVYRLDKVQRLTGLDVRKFEDALIFKISILIRKYLSNGHEIG